MPSGPPKNESTYVIDAESGEETARLLNQDVLVTQIMGPLFPDGTDLAQIHDALDIACGPGGWGLEVARTYPKITVIGVDVSRTLAEYARARARVLGLDNAIF